jgi:hypothetical protein
MVVIAKQQRAVCAMSQQISQAPDIVEILAKSLAVSAHKHLLGSARWQKWEPDAKAALKAIEAAGYAAVPLEPDTGMLRALLVHRGYDPDADEETLDGLGQLDLATMGVFVSAYRAMIAARPR